MLILLGELAQGHGPVLYVAPDNYLVSQVRAKTRADLGVDTVDDPDSPEYISGAKIAVVNIHKLFNAMSVLGGPASMRGRPLKIDTARPHQALDMVTPAQRFWHSETTAVTALRRPAAPGARQAAAETATG